MLGKIASLAINVSLRDGFSLAQLRSAEWRLFIRTVYVALRDGFSHPEFL